MGIVYIRIPDPLVEILDTDAKGRGVSRAELIRTILQMHYEQKSVFTERLKNLLQWEAASENESLQA
jgi:metal-responsive CopG/Arc/MetJ family transcriptional regulator